MGFSGQLDPEMGQVPWDFRNPGSILTGEFLIEIEEFQNFFLRFMKKTNNQQRGYQGKTILILPREQTTESWAVSQLWRLQL